MDGSCKSRTGNAFLRTARWFSRLFADLQGREQPSTTWSSTWKSSSCDQASTSHGGSFDHLDQWWKRLCSSRTFLRHSPEDEASVQLQQRGSFLQLLPACNSTPCGLQPPPELPQPMEEESTLEKKREAPDSRTVVLAPEKTRQKIHREVKKELEFLRLLECEESHHPVRLHS